MLNETSIIDKGLKFLLGTMLFHVLYNVMSFIESALSALENLEA